MAKDSGPRVDAPERARIAELLFEQARLQWQDQVSYAETIRDKRRLYATFVALVAGLGLFRIQWFRGATEVPVVSGWAWQVLVGLLTGALLLLGGSVYYLFTERSVVRLRVAGASRRRGLRWVRRPAFVRGQLVRALRAARGRGRAVDALDFDMRTAEEVLELGLEEAWLWRTFMLKLAHDELVRANVRVNRRVARGVLLMAVAYGFLAGALWWYMIVSGG